MGTVTCLLPTTIRPNLSPFHPHHPKSPQVQPTKMEKMFTSSTQRDNPTHQEYQYLDLVYNILTNGERRRDMCSTISYPFYTHPRRKHSLTNPHQLKRTRAGTISLFAPQQLRFNLKNNTFPLLTKKHVFHKAIIHEPLWFVSGSTSNAPLSAVGVKIWEENGSRAYLDSIGLTERAEGDLGPVYRFRLRHLGAKYVDCFHHYRRHFHPRYHFHHHPQSQIPASASAQSNHPSRNPVP
ncbi:unnamed protein product [Tuber melanosporum]|uniref:(Perigord truffle) hypothetical protein n=1 Tax=Tuber melanosporum (strain Mel28) TaxID=656061 RepID=D5GD05_TUBMM|nr:uncharacterized protein GSTUM_00006045001 [Tuber melanosporum]CAZ82398.1 unnamed protein product [Tuber melanosporum]